MAAIPHPQPGPAPTGTRQPTRPDPNASGDASAADVGKVLTSPWVPDHPGVTITQQYGATSYTGEPAGHGDAHWHAGVDLGYPANTIVSFPDLTQWWANLLGIAQPANQLAPLAQFHHGVWDGKQYSPDPGGYGAHAATVTVHDPSTGQPKWDVILGHASGWLTEDGAPVRPGDQLIKVDCEGNCTGPHLHFELRPVRGAYGSDQDPWWILVNGVGQSIQNVTGDIGAEVEAAAASISQAITGVEQRATDLVIGIGLAGLGAGMIGVALWLGWRAVSGGAPVPRTRLQGSPSAPRPAPPQVSRGTPARGIQVVTPAARPRVRPQPPAP